MKTVRRLLLVLLIGIFLFGCGKKSGIEGKVVDGQGKPLSGIKVTAKQVQPVKDYELFETVTGADGVFRFPEVMPVSEYNIIPSTDKWRTKVTMKIATGTEGQTLVLNSPLVLRFQTMKDNSIVDTKTSLQWLIHAATDVTYDNVLNTVKNVREGGFSDWRLPSKSDLSSLATVAAFQLDTTLSREACCVWIAEPGSDKVEWDFYTDDGNDVWASSKIPQNDRIVLVRTAGAAAPAAAPAAVTAAAPAPAPVPAPAPAPAPEKKDIPAPATEKKEVPAVQAAAPPAKTPAAAVVQKKEEPVKETVAKKEPTPTLPSPPPPAPAPKKEPVPSAAAASSAVIYFGSNQATIQSYEINKINSFASKIKGAKGKVLIEGHSDSLGSSSNKLKISIDRTIKVLDALKVAGLSDKLKVELKGMGDAKAAAENDTEEGRKLNRRVELSFVPE